MKTKESIKSLLLVILIINSHCVDILKKGKQLPSVNSKSQYKPGFIATKVSETLRLSKKKTKIELSTIILIATLVSTGVELIANIVKSYADAKEAELKVLKDRGMATLVNMYEEIKILKTGLCFNVRNSNFFYFDFISFVIMDIYFMRRRLGGGFKDGAEDPGDERINQESIDNLQLEEIESEEENEVKGFSSIQQTIIKKNPKGEDDNIRKLLHGIDEDDDNEYDKPSTQYKNYYKSDIQQVVPKLYKNRESEPNEIKPKNERKLKDMMRKGGTNYGSSYKIRNSDQIKRKIFHIQKNQMIKNSKRNLELKNNKNPNNLEIKNSKVQGKSRLLRSKNIKQRSFLRKLKFNTKAKLIHSQGPYDSFSNRLFETKQQMKNFQNKICAINEDIVGEMTFLAARSRGAAMAIQDSSEGSFFMITNTLMDFSSMALDAGVSTTVGLNASQGIADSTKVSEWITKPFFKDLVANPTTFLKGMGTDLKRVHRCFKLDVIQMGLLENSWIKKVSDKLKQFDHTKIYENEAGEELTEDDIRLDCFESLAKLLVNICQLGDYIFIFTAKVFSDVSSDNSKVQLFIESIKGGANIQSSLSQKLLQSINNAILEFQKYAIEKEKLNKLKENKNSGGFYEAMEAGIKKDIAFKKVKYEIGKIALIVLMKALGPILYIGFKLSIKFLADTFYSNTKDSVGGNVGGGAFQAAACKVLEVLVVLKIVVSTIKLIVSVLKFIKISSELKKFKVDFFGEEKLRNNMLQHIKIQAIYATFHHNSLIYSTFKDILNFYDEIAKNKESEKLVGKLFPHQKLEDAANADESKEGKELYTPNTRYNNLSLNLFYLKFCQENELFCYNSLSPKHLQKLHPNDPNLTHDHIEGIFKYVYNDVNAGPISDILVATPDSLNLSKEYLMKNNYKFYKNERYGPEYTLLYRRSGNAGNYLADIKHYTMELPLKLANSFINEKDLLKQPFQDGLNFQINTFFISDAKHLKKRKGEDYAYEREYIITKMLVSPGIDKFRDETLSANESFSSEKSGIIFPLLFSMREDEFKVYDFEKMFFEGIQNEDCSYENFDNSCYYFIPFGLVDEKIEEREICISLKRANDEEYVMDEYINSCFKEKKNKIILRTFRKVLINEVTPDAQINDSIDLQFIDRDTISLDDLEKEDTITEIPEIQKVGEKDLSIIDSDLEDLNKKPFINIFTSEIKGFVTNIYFLDKRYYTPMKDCSLNFSLVDMNMVEWGRNKLNSNDKEEIFKHYLESEIDCFNEKMEFSNKTPEEFTYDAQISLLKSKIDVVKLPVCTAYELFKSEDRLENDSVCTKIEPKDFRYIFSLQCNVYAFLDSGRGKVEDQIELFQNIKAQYGINNNISTTMLYTAANGKDLKYAKFTNSYVKPKSFCPQKSKYKNFIRYMWDPFWSRIKNFFKKKKVEYEKFSITNVFKMPFHFLRFDEPIPPFSFLSEMRALNSGENLLLMHHNVQSFEIKSERIPDYNTLTEDAPLESTKHKNIVKAIVGDYINTFKRRGGVFHFILPVTREVTITAGETKIGEIVFRVDQDLTELHRTKNTIEGFNKKLEDIKILIKELKEKPDKILELEKVKTKLQKKFKKIKSKKNVKGSNSCIFEVVSNTNTKYSSVLEINNQRDNLELKSTEKSIQQNVNKISPSTMKLDFAPMSTNIYVEMKLFKSLRWYQFMTKDNKEAMNLRGLEYLLDRCFIMYWPKLERREFDTKYNPIEPTVTVNYFIPFRYNSTWTLMKRIWVKYDYHVEDQYLDTLCESQFGKDEEERKKKKRTLLKKLNMI